MIITLIKGLVVFPFLVSIIGYVIFQSKKKSKIFASFFYALSIYYLIAYIVENTVITIVFFCIYLLYVLIDTLLYVKLKYRSYLADYVIRKYLIKFSEKSLIPYFLLILIAIIKTYIEHM